MPGLTHLLLALAFASAPLAAEARQGSIIVYDTSGSMTFGGIPQVFSGPCVGVGCRKSGSTTNMEAQSLRRIDHARRLALEALDGLVARQQDVGLVVFGQGDCNVIDVRVPFGLPDPKGAITRALNELAPRGVTPIAAALNKAAEYLQKSGLTGSEVVLITDGLENCRGDAREAARRLKGMGVKLSIVGIDATSRMSSELRDLATTGGGDYRDVKAVGTGGGGIEAGGGTDVSFDNAKKPDNLPVLAPPLLPPVDPTLPSPFR